MKSVQRTPAVQRKPAVNRRLLALTALALAVLMSACAVNNTPPPSLYQLRSEAPVTVVPVVSSKVAQVLQVAGVTLPEVLDRDALVVAQGQSGVQAVPGHRWAEPLRDAVPRLLRQDLALLLGDTRVWGAAVPAGVVVTRQLRVDVLVLQTAAARNAVLLQARWTLSDPTGRTPPVVQTAQLNVPTAGNEPDAWVVAHRLALWRLAEQVAQMAQTVR